ncbi:MAG: SDR family NAD(P)-dependent oxidoreductase, partial [Pseudomonadota bacterium]|nr:SDR family NAD(P)-dependent oxidoreductase [Pseudomonadota bacterium]
MTTNTLSSKNVVIIGGTAGIGLATAQAAAALGAKVWAAGRSEAHIENAKKLSNGSFEIRQA